MAEFLVFIFKITVIQNTSRWLHLNIYNMFNVEEHVISHWKLTTISICIAHSTYTQIIIDINLHIIFQQEK